jgi:hypothetical protein
VEDDRRLVYVGYFDRKVLRIAEAGRLPNSACDLDTREPTSPVQLLATSWKRPQASQTGLPAP